MKGTITLPLLGQIPATGRTALELQDEISERLQQKYMHNPQVSVFVHEHNSQRISVIGRGAKGRRHHDHEPAAAGRGARDRPRVWPTTRTIRSS